MAMTDEQKQKAKETRAKKAAEKAAAAEEMKTPTIEEEAKTEAAVDTAALVAAMQKQIEELTAKLNAQQSAPQVVQVLADTEKIMFLWMAEVSDDNVVTFGPNGMYGRVVGKTGSFYIPKSALSQVLDNAARFYLEKRWLIIVDGLTDEERVAFGVDYKDGEILDQKMFTRMLDFGDELPEIYGRLCESHREMVAKRMVSEYRNNKACVSVTRDLVEKMREKAKEIGVSPAPFTEILKEMNHRDTDE